MLVVKASAKPSKIHGIGLFADEKIPKGTVTWKYDPRFDISFTPEEVAAMKPMQRDFVDQYAFLSKAQGKYIFPIDDSRFTNHSSKKANIDNVHMPGDAENTGIANRDIEIGEEILVDYRSFDSYDATSEVDYLKS